MKQLICAVLTVLLFLCNQSNSSEKIKIIENLRKINSLQFNFTQLSSNGQENGSCILIYPKKMRCIYDEQKKEVLSYFQDLFEASQVSYKKLRKSVVHNDPNDNNIIVSLDLYNPRALAAIDYGDAMYTQTINDLAILCAYGAFGHENPLSALLDLGQGRELAVVLSHMGNDRDRLDRKLQVSIVCTLLKLFKKLLII